MSKLNQSAPASDGAMQESLGKRSRKSTQPFLGGDFMIDSDEDEVKGRGKGRARGKWGSKEHVDEDFDDKGKKARKQSAKGRSSGASLLSQRVEVEDMELVIKAEERVAALRKQVDESRQSKNSDLSKLEGDLNLAVMIARGPSQCQAFTGDLSVVGAWMDSVAASEWVLSFRIPLIPEAPQAGTLDLLHGAAYPLLSPRTLESLFRSVLKCNLQLWAAVSGHSSRLAHRTRRWLRMIKRGHAWQEVLRRWLLISRVGLEVNEVNLSQPVHQMDDTTAAAACAVELGKVPVHQIKPCLLLRTLRVLICDLLDTNAFGAEMAIREAALDDPVAKGKTRPGHGNSLASSASLDVLSSDPKALEESLMRRAEREREVRRALIRSEPLGTDRYERAYYHLNSTGGLIFVMEAEEKGLGVISTVKELDDLMLSCNPKGTRESALLQELSSHYESLCSSLYRLSLPSSPDASPSILQEMFPREPSTLPQILPSFVMEASRESLSLPPAAAAAAEAEAAVAAAEATAVGKNCKGKAAAVQAARAAAEASLVADGDYSIYYRGPERRFKDLFKEDQEMEVVEELNNVDDEEDGESEGDLRDMKIDLRTKEGRELKRRMQEEGIYPDKKAPEASGEPKIDLRTKEGRELKRLIQEEEEREAKRADVIKKAALKEKRLQEEREMDLGSLIANDVASGLSVAKIELAWLIQRIRFINKEPEDAASSGSWRSRASSIDNVQVMLQVLIEVEAELQSLADGLPEQSTNEDLAPLVKEAEDFEVEFVLPPDDDGQGQGQEEDEEVIGKVSSQRKLIIELEELDDSETEERQREKMHVAAAIVTEIAAGTDPSLIAPKPRVGLWRSRRDRAVWLRDVRRCQLGGLMTHSLYVCGLLVDRAEVLVAGIVVGAQEAERRANHLSLMPRLFKSRVTQEGGGDGGDGLAAADGGAVRGKRAASLGVNALIAKVGSRKLKREQEERENEAMGYMGYQ